MLQSGCNGAAADRTNCKQSIGKVSGCIILTEKHKGFVELQGQDGRLPSGSN